MRVLFLNTVDSGGGAARAAARLLHGVRDAGVDARMMVQRQHTVDPVVMGASGRFGNGVAIARGLLDGVPLRFYPGRNGFSFSPAFLPDNLQRGIDVINPDIVHLHWLGEGFLRLETLARLERPLVWTMHDSWTFTGGCHIPFDCLNYREKCGCCPTLGSNRQNDLSRWVWQRKKRIFSTLNLTVVAPSRWLAKCAAASSLLHGIPIEVIPNGIDLDLFRPSDKLVARRILGLPPDKKLILFGAMSGASDRNKGFHLLQPALQLLAARGWEKRAGLLVFGSTEPVNAPDFGLRTHYLGHLNEDSTLALLYAAADLFVAPSIQENLSNTVMEAMACGTPSVAFDVGGMSDLIEHKHNGYLARPYETDDLAEGISWGLDNEEQWRLLSRHCREKVAEFSLETISRRYIELYNTILPTGAAQAYHDRKTARIISGGEVSSNG